jgi:TPR repeat protein
MNYSCVNTIPVAEGRYRFSAVILRMKKLWFNISAGVLAVALFCAVASGADIAFDAATFPGQWTLATNQDETIIATGSAVLRRGEEVYQRIMLLKAVPVETAGQPGKITEAEVRKFISHYRPPPIPYTSAKTAAKTGAEKFNCLEFAEDIVIQAGSNAIPAEVIGIKFKDRLIGHACAGFPVADGRTLYFDSTPGAGQVSRAASEARVELGKPYRRADGGVPAGGVENLPVTEIIPVSKLMEIAGSLLDDSGSAAPAAGTRLVVVGEKHQQAEGIEYVGPDTLKISDSQLERWNQAAGEFLAAKVSKLEAQKKVEQAVATKLSAVSLVENERLAAQGDAYGELRMGERYLSGEGVAKDVFKARDYLQRAAEQGSQTASDELNRLDNQN